jgi:hypothetical protein
MDKRRSRTLFDLTPALSFHAQRLRAQIILG